MVHVSVLRAIDGKKLAKRVTPTEVIPYGLAFIHNHTDVPVNDIYELSALLTRLESDVYSCIVRGRLIEDFDESMLAGLDPERVLALKPTDVLRRLSSYDGYPAFYEKNPDGVHWCMIDFDKVEAPAGLTSADERLAYLVSLLPAEFHDASFHFQWSSQAGLEGWDALRCHLWFWLSERRTDNEMEAWAQNIGIDHTVMRTIQVHYTAAPIFEGVVDPFAGGGRSGFVRGAKDAVTVPIVAKPQPTYSYGGAADPNYTPAPSFADRLQDINGIGMNDPILRAAASWISRHGENDIATLKQLIRERVALSGRSTSEQARYGSDRYLDDCIRGAVAKFGADGFEQNRDDDDEALRKKLTHMRERAKPHCETGIIINTFEEGCGAGKTTEILRRIAAHGGRWVYAVDRIDLMKERHEDFQTKFPSAMAFELYDAHSKKDDQHTVIGQLVALRQKLNKLSAPNVIVFITHQALSMMDWAGWEDFSCVIDEVLDVWRTARQFLPHNAHLLQGRYLEIDRDDGDAYILRLTAAGALMARNPSADEIERHFYPLLLLANRPNSYLWVDKTGWDDSVRNEMVFWTLLTPSLLRPFKSVTMLGNALGKSVTHAMWTHQYGVEWRRQSFKARERQVPLSDRLTIRYFSNDNASFARFKKDDNPLGKIVAWLRANEPEEFIWTVNERFTELVDKSGGLPGRKLTPRQHGTNEFVGFTRAVWLAAMQSSQQESDAVFRVAGMTKSALIEAREFEAMIQFIMRCSARAYDRADPVICYVFSKAQAEYAVDVLGGRIELIDGVVGDRVKPKGGRPKKHADEAERNREKMRASRARKKAQDSANVVTETPLKDLAPEVSVTHPVDGELSSGEPDDNSDQNYLDQIGCYSSRRSSLSVEEVAAAPCQFDRARVDATMAKVKWIRSRHDYV